MPKPYYQIAEFEINNDSVFRDFMIHRGHWWDTKPDSAPEYRNLFSVTKRYGSLPNTYYIEVKAYRRQRTDSIYRNRGEVA